MKKLQIKKTIAILLAVLFLVTVTAGAVSAGRTGPINIPETGKIPGVSALINHYQSGSTSHNGPMGPTPFPTIFAEAGRTNKISTVGQRWGPENK